MRFPKLEIENFLAITKAEINLADRGLIAIQGINHADTSSNSNGAGKSSIADALCWCIFGTTARGESGDNVINQSAGKNCRVGVTIQDGSISYFIARHRKHKTGKNGLTVTMSDGLTETDLTKGTDRLTQEVVDQIVGSSHDVFSGSIYAGQEKMPDLPAMTDKALKMLIEEASGITVLEEAYKKAREAAQATEAKVNAEAIQVAGYQSYLERLYRDRNGLKIQIEDHDKKKALRLQEVATQARGVVTRIKTLDLEIKTFDPAAIVNAIQDIDRKIAGVSGENVKLAEHQKIVADIQAKSQIAKSNIKTEQTSLDHARKNLANVNARIGQPCGECGRDITAAEIANTTRALQDKMDVHARILKDHKDAFEKAEVDLALAMNERDMFAAGMTDITAEQTERKRLEDQHGEYRQRVSAREILMAEAKSLKEQIAEIGARVNPYHERLKETEVSIGEVEKNLESAQRRVKGAEQALEVEKQVVRVFSPAGVRARILDEVTPFLNAQTSKYLDTLSDGNISATWSTLTPAAKKGEFREKFSIDVQNVTGGGSFGRLSGGEKRKVRVATTLALQDLVSTRASKPIELFIGDEIDDALDASGLERLMIILEEKAKERGSVFVISHNDLADSIRQTLTIEKLASGETKVTEMAS